MSKAFRRPKVTSALKCTWHSLYETRCTQTMPSVGEAGLLSQRWLDFIPLKVKWPALSEGAVNDKLMQPRKICSCQGNSVAQNSWPDRPNAILGVQQYRSSALLHYLCDMFLKCSKGRMELVLMSEVRKRRRGIAPIHRAAMGQWAVLHLAAIFGSKQQLGVMVNFSFSSPFTAGAWSQDGRQVNEAHKVFCRDSWATSQSLVNRPWRM